MYAVPCTELERFEMGIYGRIPPNAAAHWWFCDPTKLFQDFRKVLLSHNSCFELSVRENCWHGYKIFAVMSTGNMQDSY